MRLSLPSSIAVVLVVAALSLSQSGAAPRPEQILETKAGSLAFAPDGSTLATSQDKTVLVWDRATGKRRHELAGHTADVQALAFSPDGAYLASAGTAEVVVWEARSGNRKTHIPRKLTHSEEDGRHARPFVAFSPDGAALAFGPEEGGVSLWDMRRGVAGKALEPAGFPVSAVAFSPDGKKLAVGTATGDNHGAVILFDPESGKKQSAGAYTYAIYSPVLTVAFSAQGDRVLSAHLDGTVCWYDFAKKKMESKRLLLAKDRAQGMTFASGAEKLALARDNQLELWDAHSLRSVRRLDNVTGAMAFSHDGKAVAAHHRGVLNLWRLE
jgi:WD40 repeat protein